MYSTIIDKIIADSKDDFEAAGLDQDTLQELKTVRQILPAIQRHFVVSQS